MSAKKIFKYVGIFFLLAVIIYCGSRMIVDEGNDKGSATISVASGTPESLGLDLSGIDKVEIPDGIPSIIKEYEGFTVSFNPENKTPNYVAWILDGRETEGTVSRSNQFWTDNELEGCPDTRDYSRSGYDRGHMCPSGEQKWSEDAMNSCFVMANICPQNHDLNTGAWKTLEDKERIWAKRDSSIVIIAGPIYEKSDRETIGYSEVRVPSAFFKVLLAPYENPIRAIGFVYPNMRCDGNMASYAVSVDDVEKLTGLDFFSVLPDNIEDEIESIVSFRDWNNNKRMKKQENEYRDR